MLNMNASWLKRIVTFLKRSMLIVACILLATWTLALPSKTKPTQKQTTQSMTVIYHQNASLPNNFRLLRLVGASIPSRANYSLINHTFYVAPFNKIIVNNDVNATITVGTPVQDVIATGTRGALLCFSPHVENHTLYIGYRPFYDIHHVCKNVSVHIHTHHLEKIIQKGYGQVLVNNLNNTSLDVEEIGNGTLSVHGNNIGLHSFYYRGRGNVYINKVNTASLQVNAKGFGVIAISGVAKGVVLHAVDAPNFRLTGDIGLASLDYDGPGILTIYWVDSPSLHVRISDDSRVQLAGIVGLLNAKVTHHGVLDARYLRAETVAVETDYYATAHVWANYALYAFAKNYSNIYYYHRSEFLSTLGKQSGSILPIYQAPSSLLHFDPPHI